MISLIGDYVMSKREQRAGDSRQSGGGGAKGARALGPLRVVIPKAAENTNIGGSIMGEPSPKTPVLGISVTELVQSIHCDTEAGVFSTQQEALEFIVRVILAFKLKYPDLIVYLHDCRVYPGLLMAGLDGLLNGINAEEPFDVEKGRIQNREVSLISKKLLAMLDTQGFKKSDVCRYSQMVVSHEDPEIQRVLSYLSRNPAAREEIRGEASSYLKKKSKITDRERERMAHKLEYLEAQTSEPLNRVQLYLREIMSAFCSVDNKTSFLTILNQMVQGVHAWRNGLESLIEKQKEDCNKTEQEIKNAEGKETSNNDSTLSFLRAESRISQGLLQRYQEELDAPFCPQDYFLPAEKTLKTILEGLGLKTKFDALFTSDSQASCLDFYKVFVSFMKQSPILSWRREICYFLRDKCSATLDEYYESLCSAATKDRQLPAVEGDVGFFDFLAGLREGDSVFKKELKEKICCILGRWKLEDFCLNSEDEDFYKTLSSIEKSHPALNGIGYVPKERLKDFIDAVYELRMASTLMYLMTDMIAPLKLAKINKSEQAPPNSLVFFYAPKGLSAVKGSLPTQKDSSLASIIHAARMLAEPPPSHCAQVDWRVFGLQSLGEGCLSNVTGFDDVFPVPDTLDRGRLALQGREKADEFVESSLLQLLLNATRALETSNPGAYQRYLEELSRSQSSLLVGVSVLSQRQKLAQSEDQPSIVSPPLTGK